MAKTKGLGKLYPYTVKDIVCISQHLHGPIREYFDKRCSLEMIMKGLSSHINGKCVFKTLPKPLGNIVMRMNCNENNKFRIFDRVSKFNTSYGY